MRIFRKHKIFEYNIMMYFNYYRVFSPAFLLQCFIQFCSTVLWYRLLMNLRVNKWSLQLNPSVSCLCLYFEFNPTPKSHIDSSIPNMTYFGTQWRTQSQSRDRRTNNWKIKYEVWSIKLNWLNCYELFTKEWCHVTSHPVVQ